MTALLCTKMYAVNDVLIKADVFPNKLSDFSFFKDASAQIPHDEVLPYELISTLFSDYSYKQRWVYVPKNTKAQYKEDWVFDFPEGSALIKTFYYPVDERNPEKGKNLLVPEKTDEAAKINLTQNRDGYGVICDRTQKPHR